MIGFHCLIPRIDTKKVQGKDHLPTRVSLLALVLPVRLALPSSRQPPLVIPISLAYCVNSLLVQCIFRVLFVLEWMNPVDKNWMSAYILRTKKAVLECEFVVVVVVVVFLRLNQSPGVSYSLTAA